MVCIMGFTNDDIVDILNMKNFAGSTIAVTLPRGVYGISDLNMMLKSLLPREVKVNFTIDDIRLRSNLTTNKTMFAKEFFSTQF